MESTPAEMPRELVSCPRCNWSALALGGDARRWCRAVLARHEASEAHLRTLSATAEAPRPAVPAASAFAAGLPLQRLQQISAV